MSQAEPDSVNRFSVREEQGEQGWDVLILDPQGAPVWKRPCRTESEARTFGSTVRQHVYWLSEDKFREYYRLGEPG